MPAVLGYCPKISNPLGQVYADFRPRRLCANLFDLASDPHQVCKEARQPMPLREPELEPDLPGGAAPIESDITA
jgi:hypothetical protein